MANKTWVGTTGAWDTAGNWSPSGVPTNGDDVFFTTGSQSVTSGLNQSAVALASLRIGPGYTGDIAASGGYLQIDATTVEFSGAGSIWIDGTYTTVRVTGAQQSDAVNLDGSITNLQVIGSGVIGAIAVANSATCTNTVVQSAPAAQLTVGTSVTATQVDADSGVITFGSALTTCNIYGGAFTHTAGAITTLNLEDEAIFIDQSSGTITTLNGYGGKFDGTSQTNASKTITNVTTYENFELDLRSGLNNYTLTNDIIYRGGVIRPDIGVTMALS